MPARSLLARVPAGVRRDYVATTAAHWLTLGAGLLLFHLVARRAGVAGFAYYQVARGMVSTVQPLALIGLVSALHRYLPRAGRRIRVLARQAFLLEVVLLNVVGLAAVALAGDVGRLFGIGGAREVRAAVVLTAGVCLCTVSSAALRGCGQVGRSVLASLLGFGVLPLAAFLVTSRMHVFLTVQGVAMTVVACWGIAEAGPRRAERRATPRPAPPLRTVLRYGIRRTPGDVALPGLFAFPTFFVAATSHSSAEAGYVGFATSAITLICAIFGMLNPVLLPRLSGHAADTEAAGRTFGAELAHGLKVLPFAAAGVAALASVTLLVVATPLVHWFLGADFSGADTMIRFGAPVSIPLAVYYAARPTIDALREAPVTTVLLVGSLAVEVAATYGAAALGLDAWQAALAGFGAAAVVLAVSSYIALLRAIPVPAIRSKP